MNARTALVRVRYFFRTKISHLPAVYLPLAGLKDADGDGDAATVITDRTELTVEAFPRSGNTFAIAALRLAEPKLDIAHHLHAPAQLIRAAKLRKPALLIVRQPRDSVTSFVLRHPEIPIGQALNAWIFFHEKLAPYADSFVVATFDQVVCDFGGVLKRINEKFGLTLAEFVHSDENVRTCFDRIEARNARRFGEGVVQEASVARPSSVRKQVKSELDSQWSSPRAQTRLRMADSIYIGYCNVRRRN